MRFAEIREQCLRDMGHASTSPSDEQIATVENRINAAYLGLAGLANWVWWRNRLDVAVQTGLSDLSMPRNFTHVFSMRTTADNKKVWPSSTDDHEIYQTKRQDIGKRTYAPGPSSLRKVQSLTSVTTTLDSDLVTSVEAFTASAVGRLLYLPASGHEYIITELVDDYTARLHEAFLDTGLSGVAAQLDPAGTRRLTLSMDTSGTSEEVRLWYYFRPDRLEDDDDEPLFPEEFHHYLVAAPRDKLLQVQRESSGLTAQARYESQEILSDMKRANLQLLRDIQRGKGMRI